MVLKNSHMKEFVGGVLSGVGWSLGVTVGFAIVSTVIVVFLNRAGGIPVVGEFIARIVNATLTQLSSRTPIYLQ